MDVIEFGFTSPWWMLILIPAAVLIILSAVLAARRNPEGRIPKTALALTLCAAVLLSVAAGGLYVRTETDKCDTVFLLDMSDSTEDARDDIVRAYELLKKSSSVPAGARVLVFGANQREGLVSPVDASATDLSAALLYAGEQVGREGRIILVTDGRETVGDAITAAGQLAGKGIRVDSVYAEPVRSAAGEVLLRSMTASGGTFAGTDVTLTVTAAGQEAGDAVVRFYDGNTLLGTQPVSCAGGETQVSFITRVETGGLHLFRAEIVSENDTEERNNIAEASVDTGSLPRVLLLAPDEAHAGLLAEALSSAAEVTVRTEGEAPDTFEELCAFDGIYLLNCDASRLPADFGSLLSRAAEEGGKYVCLVGGEDTYQRGGMAGTDYEAMLPVTFGTWDGSSSLLLLLLDASGSMVSGADNQLEEAKIAASRVVQSLPAGTEVGIITFSDDAVIESEPLPATAENKTRLLQCISAIGRRSGTAFLPALTAAEGMVQQSSAKEKHIIFLSDGMPADSQTGILKTVDRLAMGGVTLGVISLGDANGGLSFLRQMAERGGGNYTTANLSSLSDVMLTESERVSGPYLVRTPCVPVPVGRGETLVQDVLPSIRGYVGTTPRDDAELLLTSQDGQPIYAVRTCGAGKTAVFTGDLSHSLCKDLLTSESGRSFLKAALLDGVMNARNTSPADAAESLSEYDCLRPGDPMLLSSLSSLTGGTAVRLSDEEAVNALLTAGNPVRQEDTLLVLPLCALSAVLLLVGVIVRRRKYQ